MAVAKGKSVAEINNKLAQARLRPTGGAGVDDVAPSPMGDMMQRVSAIREDMQERRLAETIIGQTEAEMEMAKAETEAKKLELEVKTLENRTRLQEMRDKLAGGGSGGEKDALLFAILEKLMDKDEKGVAGGLESFATAVSASLTELRGEIRAISSNSGREPDADPLEKLAASMEMLGKLKEAFTAFTPQAAANPTMSAAQMDLDTTIKMNSLQMEHEYRMTELRQREERWKSDQELKRREVESEERRAQYLGDGIKQLATAAQPIIAELAAAATARSQQPPVVSYPTAAPMPVPVQVTVQPEPVPAMAAAYAMPEPEQATGKEPFGCEACQYQWMIDSDRSISEVECPNCHKMNIVDWDN